MTYRLQVGAPAGVEVGDAAVVHGVAVHGRRGVLVGCRGRGRVMVLCSADPPPSCRRSDPRHRAGVVVLGSRRDRRGYATALTVRPGFQIAALTTASRPGHPGKVEQTSDSGSWPRHAASAWAIRSFLVLAEPTKAPSWSSPVVVVGMNWVKRPLRMRTASHCPREIATLTRLRSSRKSMPRGTSAIDDAVIDTMTNDCFAALELIDRANQHVGEATLVQRPADRVHLGVVGRDDEEVLGD